MALIETTTGNLKSSWQLRTNGDVQGRVRNFLADVWRRDQLDGMIAPVYEAEGGLPGPKVLWNEDQLKEVDPFIPLVKMGGTRLIEKVKQEKPRVKLGAVLHSCEARALIEQMKRGRVEIGDWLLIGVDCLASFPQADYAWRVEKAGGVQELTREVLRNARQGGISADRFRSACQACVRPGAQMVDVCIGIAGMPVKEYALVRARDGKSAARLGLEEITDGPAPGWLVEQNERVLKTMAERHARMKLRLQSELEAGFPNDVVEWMGHLEACGECRTCLDACPLYSNQLELGPEAVADWLVSCVACGACDDVCPRQLPLSAMVERIVHHLHADLIPA